MRNIRPHQHGAALHPCISGPASDQQGSVHHHNQLKTVMAVTGSCEARSHHDHRGRPCKRATIWTNEHTSRGFATNSTPLISASIFKTAEQLKCYFTEPLFIIIHSPVLRRLLRRDTYSGQVHRRRAANEHPRL